MLISSILDMAVYSKNMVRLGKVKDVEIDDEFKITHLILELERGATKQLFDKLIAIRHGKGRVTPMLVEKIGKDAVILKQTVAELKGAVESF